MSAKCEMNVMHEIKTGGQILGYDRREGLMGLWAF